MDISMIRRWAIYFSSVDYDVGYKLHLTQLSTHENEESLCILTHKNQADKSRLIWTKWSPHSIVVNVWDFDIVVSKFKLQSCYYIHFQTNALGKGMNPLSPPAMG